MLKLGSTYLKTKDMDKSINFYSALLEMKPSSQNFDRWAQFDFHNQCIALWNPEYDRKKITSGEDLVGIYSNDYITFFMREKIKYGNNVVLNFYIDDLKSEHERVKKLEIGEVTSIMYMNVAMPYYLFIVTDPDGNEIEVTGKYEGDLK